jgi:hypothetical protein
MQTPPDEPASLLSLPDGRRLAYLAVGPDDGAPVFHFHGQGACSPDRIRPARHRRFRSQ